MPGSASNFRFLNSPVLLGSRLLCITVEPPMQFTPCLQLILSLILFLLALPLVDVTYLCWDLTKAELSSRYQQCNSQLLRNYCSCFPPRVQLQGMWRHGLGKSLCHCWTPCLFCMEKRALFCLDVSLIYFTVTPSIHPSICMVKHTSAVVSVMWLLMAERAIYQLSHLYWNHAEVVKQKTGARKVILEH